ncbi:P22 phage major capsid protein family protein [Pasteurella multocida]|uniref:P22 phage major capsid protein family protein n=1 Tax=Pasteurella multocida TaxID=747 RepID=UPI00147D6472|nr:P22 phage major capsid protein family protein [Pasteurella multocida]NNI15515.1 P22 coat - protein 5 family protein [Pasteurella multocida]
MAEQNTLTAIAPSLYAALNTVSREMVGFIPAVNRNSTAERAALGDEVTVPIASAGELEDISPGQQPKNSGGTTPESVKIKMEHSKAAPIIWTSEDEKRVSNAGVYNGVLADQFADGMRKLVNSIERDVASKALIGASRAYGEYGKTPFGTAGNLSDFAGVARILDDNGCPIVDRQLVVNSGAMANLRGVQSVLFKVNEAGSADMLRDGYTDRVQGFALRNSAGISMHKQGNAASKTLNGGAATGLRELALQAGTGDFKAGDLIYLNDDKNNIYTVAEDLGNGAGKLKINAPGIVTSMSGSETITLFGDFTPNFAFDRNAIVLATRAPAQPTGGDSAEDVMFLTDPVTGLVFEVRVYRQYRQVKFEIGMTWGAKVINSRHLAILAG